MKFKRAIYNVVFGLMAQILTIALGIVVPRLILKGYGSEVNGLFSTINNIYTYLALIEGGIATSALQALYKPVRENNRGEINQILSTTKKYYHRCSIYYFVGVLSLAVILPFAVQTTINRWVIVGIVILQGMASLMNFYLIASLTVLLSAEGKGYVQTNITLVTNVLTNVVKIVLVNLSVNIVFLQVGYFCVSMISILIYLIYFKRNYGWIDTNNRGTDIALKQKNAFLVHQIVYVIFNNTDVVLLSVLCGLKVSSVYAIYNMLFVYILSLINSIFNGLKFTLGHVYSESREKYVTVHDTYQSLYCAFVFAMFSICYILIAPFIRLYTDGISDIQYADKYLPILFCMVNLLSCCRSTENNLISLAFHAQQTLPRTIAEAVINLGCSILLIRQFGIYGCLLGTIIALLYRTNDIIIYANTRILKRKPIRAYITVLTNFALFFLIVWGNRYMNLHIGSYMDFVFWGCVLTPCIFAVYIIVNGIVNVKGYQYIGGIVSNRIMRRKQK